MARGKKAVQVLTPEKKLAHALVPMEEQPYQLPENWCWTRLLGVIVSSDEKAEDFSNLELKYVGLENLEKDGGIIGYGSPEGIKSLKNVFHSGQILYGKLRPYLNKHDIATFDGICSTDILVFSTREPVLPQIVNYYFNQSKFIEYAVGNSKGINLPRVSENVILNAVFPLPPLAEQHRIVDRIESIFAKLDEAKEKAQTVVDGFELRKSAILHKAFTGELTAKWREEHGMTLDRWTKSTFSDVVDEFKYGLSEKSDYGYDGIPVFRIPNVTDNGLSFDDLKYLSHSQIDSSSLLRKDDVLIIRSNGSKELVGKSVLVPSLDKEYTYASFLIRARLNTKIVPAYFVYYINSSDARIQMFKKAKSSAGINNINSKELGAINILVCSVSEQSEIVRILDEFLDKENAAKEAAEAVLDQIDTMKKAVLARAFRGELGTNDPTEESAVELLKTML